ncbi:MAG TPA: nicotinate phosphoribosyltransferase [Candidatus Binatus sp.]|nr:nicotinate phosphoribosyltransferase [Candidatus Binatus sp.]
MNALLTDLYQLTMLHAYFRGGMDATAVFEFFVRRLPAGRGFLLAAGLEQVLDYLQDLRFTEVELAWLRESGRFEASFVDHLAALRFTGDVDAMAEGTVCFADEPILRVMAPLPQAQLVETRVINLLQLQTLIASKAARAVLAAPGKVLVDFGLRRAHGAEAGLLAARAGYMAGLAGTSNVLAGMRFGVPLYGTMAHSFVQTHVDEAEAFLRFAEAEPQQVVLLLDTYDTEAAAEKVVALGARLRRARGIRVHGVRLDSGDLAAHARRVRAILDRGGLQDVTIFASGSLDEFAVRDLLATGAPIDGFGLGSRLDTSADAPYLDCVYKLQEYDGRARRKRSEEKATWPGRKQVYRSYDPAGRMTADVLTLDGDRQDGEPLLEPVMRGGRRLGPAVPLVTARARAAAQLVRLPEPLRRLEAGASYPVRVAAPLRALAEAVDAATH